MRCRRSNSRGSVVKNNESRIPISDNGTNPHVYIEPASIWDNNVHSSRAFSFSDHIHLSLHNDENIGNGIIFSIDLTWTYYMTEFCVFSVTVWKVLMEQDDLFHDFSPTSPRCWVNVKFRSIVHVIFFNDDWCTGDVIKPYLILYGHVGWFPCAPFHRWIITS